MAEQLPYIIEETSEEYNKDTDVNDVSHCDPCKDEGIQVKAAGFCVDDYLCAECCQIHKRARPSKNHLLKDENSIQKSEQKKERKSKQCQEHQKEPIIWYCKSHDKCICDICKHVNHRNCADFKSVEQASKDFLSSDKLKHVKDRLVQLREQFEENLPRVKKNTEAVESQHTALMEAVTISISKIGKKDLERLKSLEVTCDTTVKTLRSLFNEIETVERNEEEDLTFVATRTAESRLQAFVDRLESVLNDNKFTRCRYVSEPFSNAEGMIGKLFALKDRRALNIDHIDVNTSADSKCSDITGMEILSNNRLIIADYNNYKIKLVDLTKRTVISELKLDRRPWDLTRIDDNAIVVISYEEEIIICVSISDTLTVQKTINKRECKDCRGIVCTSNTLIISRKSPFSIQILNWNETVKHTIEDKDEHGTVRFGEVLYMTQGLDTNILYLSDASSNTVSSMTLDGQVISSFTHEHLRDPRGIMSGKDGLIFVCSYTTNKIFEISSDLSEGLVILDEKDGIKRPYSIIYNDDVNKLYVGCEKNRSIQVFLI